MRAACKMITKKLGIRILMFCLFLVVAVSACIVWGNEARADSRTIRVGYIDYKGFIENINGNYSGYGVDYLEKIAEYNSWKYDYVYDTWENCLERLEQGEIDLVCTAQYTSERAKRFAYAQMPLGYESTILYVREDSDIYYNDFPAMDGCRVGLLQESFQTAEFAVFAEEHDLEYEPCYYATEQEIVTALKNGDVDMIAVGSLARHTNVKAVGRYGAEAFYCITGKDNEAALFLQERRTIIFSRQSLFEFV